MGIEIDFEKARTLLKYVARANKKIIECTQSVKILHEDLKKLKKVTSKSVHPHIAKLEKKILETLKKGGFVEECKEPQQVEVQLTRVMEETQTTQEAGSESSEQKNREEKIHEIEARSREKAEQVHTAVDLNICNLEKMLQKLERIKRTIKVKGKFEREQLNNVASKIKLLKGKISLLKEKDVSLHSEKKLVKRKKFVEKKHKVVKTKKSHKKAKKK